MKGNRLNAKQRWVVATDATATVYAGITPAAGCAYRVIEGYGYHDEGAPLNSYFTLDVADGGGYIDLSDAAALASGTKQQLYSVAVTRDSLILRYGMTLRFVALSKTNGKTVGIRLLVEEIRGAEQYVG